MNARQPIDVPRDDPSTAPREAGASAPLLTLVPRVPRWIAQAVAGTVALILALILFAWLIGAFEGMSAQGGIALVIGIAAATGLGVGLMALVFYSSRSGDDEPARWR